MKILTFITTLFFLSSCVVKDKNECLVAGCEVSPGGLTVNSPGVSSPSSNPYYSSGSSLTISGSCIDGSTVNLTGDDNQTVICSGSSYSFLVVTDSDGPKNFTVTQTSSGTTSPPTSLVWNRDTTNPSAPTITAPAFNPYSSGAKSLTLSGSCEVGSTVSLGGSGTGTYTCSSGTYSFTINNVGVSDGTYDYSISQTDRAGNTSSPTAFQWEINSSNPAPTISIPASSPYYSSGSSLTISGTCRTGATVDLTGYDTQAVTCSGSTYSFSVTSNSDGVRNFSISQTYSGATSSSISLVWNRDTANPTAPTITSPASNPYNSAAKSLTLSGTCETGSTVSLGGAGTGTYTCSSESYSFTINKVGANDGAFNYSVSQTDRAGNASSPIAFQWNIINSIAAPTISSPASSPYYTSGSSLTISGTCLSGATVDLTGYDTQAVTCSSSSYSFTVTTDTDGAKNFSITQSAYEVTSSATSLVWNRDTTNPSAPTITAPAFNPYSSIAKSLTLSGACEVGSTVSLGGSGTGTYTCSSGTYSFTINNVGVDDGTYNYSISQTDRAGNASSSTAFQWEINSSNPAPTISIPASSPYYSSGSSLTISGTCRTGATVDLTGYDTQAVTCSGSTYSFSVTSNSDGAKNFSISQTYSGNTSSSISLVWNRDTVNPSAPTITSPASNPYSSPAKSLTLSGACETGSTVSLGGAGSGTYTCSSESYSFTINKVGANDGAFNYSVSQTDRAGNASSPIAFQWNIINSIAAPTISSPASSPYYTSGSSLTISGTCLSGATVDLTGYDTQAVTCSSSSYSFTVTTDTDGAKSFSITQSAYELTSSSVSLVWNRDTANPSAPTITAPDTNPYSSPAKILTLSGACELGSTVSIQGSGTGTYSCSSGTYSFTINKVGANDGTFNYSISQTDRAGNASSSTSFTWNIINSIAAPTIETPSESPYYSSGSSLTISGSCLNGATVNLNGFDTQTTTCSGSSYSFLVTTNSDGAKSFSLTQSAYELTSSATSFVWNRDTTNPSAPTITSPSTNPYNSIAMILTLSGACEVGSIVSIGGAGTGTYTCASGTYTFSIDKTNAPNGTYTYSISQTDRAGNTSSSTSFQWDINSSDPAPTITTPLLNPYYSNETSLTIGGTCASGKTVYLSGFTSNSTSCSVGLTYSFSATCSALQVSSCVNDGTYVYSVAQKSTGLMSDSVSKIWVRDTLAPNPIVFSKSNPFVSGDSTLTLVGTCEEGATVSLTTDAAVNTICTDGIFSLPISGSCSGSCDYTVKQTDKAGNSSPSTTFSWIFESTMPATPTITSPTSLKTYNQASSFDITGTCTGTNNVVLSGFNSATGVAITAANVTGGSLTKVCTSGIFSFTFNQTVDGQYDLYIIQQIPETANTPAIDSASVLRIWVRDTSTPSLVTIFNPTSPYTAVSPYTAGGSLYISGSCEDYAIITLTGSSSATTTCSNGFFSFVVSETTNGVTYDYSITQTDRAGNASNATTIYWHKDNSISEAPRILNPIITPYKYNGSSIIISGTCTSGLTVDLTGADLQSSTCTNGAFSFTSTQPDGTYVYLVSQGSGSEKSPNASVSWIKDTIGPTVTIGGTITEGSSNANTTAIFTLSANEAVQSYQCSLDSGVYAPCVSPITYDGLPNTSHSLSVKAIDLSGNWGSVTTRNWTQSAFSTIALYHFNSGTTTLTDSSTGATNNFTSSGISIVAGKISNALSYTSGSSSVSALNNSSQARLNTRMTAEFWFRVSSKLSNNKFTPIITKMGASTNMGWELGVKALGSNDYIIFRGSNNGTTTQEVRSTSLAISTNTWYHVAATYNRGTIRFFFNGVPKGSASISGSVAADLFASTAPLRIGKTDASSTTQELTGLVDELRLSQTIRYSTTFTPSTTEFAAD